MIHIVDALIALAVLVSWVFAVSSCFTEDDRKSTVRIIIAYIILSFSFVAALKAPQVKDEMKLEKAVTAEQQKEERAAEYTCQAYAELYQYHEGTIVNYDQVQRMDWLSTRDRESVAGFLDAAARVNRTLNGDLDHPLSRKARYNAVYLNCMADGNQESLCEKLPKADQANCR